VQFRAFTFHASRFYPCRQSGKPLDPGGNSHHINFMPSVSLERKKLAGSVTVVADYDAAADAKQRISLRNAKTKYFHVQALSNGGYLLEPRVLVPPAALSSRTRKMLERSVANVKKGIASPLPRRQST
jgi:hypothetical protein